MRTAVRILGAAALLAAGLAVAGPAPAFANDPAPWCDTGASHFICSTNNGTIASSWTVYRAWGGSTVTVPGSGSYLYDTCHGNTTVRVYYSYVSGGVTYNSGTQQFLCNPGDWP